jgi:hypothetical protein
MTLRDEIIIRSIKILDIGYIGAIYCFLGIGIATLIDWILGPYDVKKAQSQPTWRLFLGIILYVWLLGVLVYIVRNVVELIPFPLDGVHGFEHRRVKEIGSAMVFTYILCFYSFNLQQRLRTLYKRVTGRTHV